MRNRIPPEAFEHYRALGPGRSYAAVAAHYGVSVRGVTKRALKENWQGRLATIEREAQRKQDERAVEDLQAVNERHLKTARAVLARGLEALRSLPLTTAVTAVRAIESAVKLERLVLGADRRPEGQGVSWAEIVDEVQRAAQAREVRGAGCAVVSVPPPPPIVPPVLASRVFGEN